MSDLTVNDFNSKPQYPIKRISIYRNGSWVFTTFSKDDVVFIDGTSRFVRVGTKFGLCRTNQDDPSKPEFRGKAGDFIVVDRQGGLALMKDSVFRSMYPEPKKSSSNTQNSSSFLKTKYLGNSVENSSVSESNMKQETEVPTYSSRSTTRTYSPY